MRANWNPRASAPPVMDLLTHSSVKDIFSVARRKCLKTPHRVEELVDGGELKVRIAALLFPQRGCGALRVVMPGIENRVVIQRSELAIQAPPHLFRISARQIHAAARVDEQSVSRDQIPFHQEA